MWRELMQYCLCDIYFRIGVLPLQRKDLEIIFFPFLGIVLLFLFFNASSSQKRDASQIWHRLKNEMHLKFGGHTYVFFPVIFLNTHSALYSPSTVLCFLLWIIHTNPYI